ncbi:MAG: 4'-phosphopantetheinyl transferase superfamily protein [Betaproteobacteria bacterium]|nr:4'-phosphopantetheinyl transferase superfamily protein [Betaproteobacteria bacterium]
MNQHSSSSKLYLLDLGDGIDEAIFREWSQRIPEERSAALSRFHFRADAERSLAGEILARAALSMAAALPPSAFRFARGPHGKPAATSALPHRAPLPEFNISHSGQFVACAISSRPIGVDVEKFFSPDEAMLQRICAPGESAFIRKSAGLSPAAAFTLLWTLKESWLKARGQGLEENLPGIDFSPFLSRPSAFTAKAHRFQSFFRDDYAISVCERL